MKIQTPKSRQKAPQGANDSYAFALLVEAELHALGHSDFKMLWCNNEFLLGVGVELAIDGHPRRNAWVIRGKGMTAKEMAEKASTWIKSARD